MTRPLPFPGTLRAAVETVIDQNKAQGYSPNRFIQITAQVRDAELPNVCSRLILDAGTLEWMEKALYDYPGLLFLEDLVARYGEHYDLGKDVIEHAQARALLLDQVADIQRFG